MKFLLLLFVSLSVFAATMPDYEKEQRWATQVEDGLMDGEVVEITGGNKPFIGIFMENENEANKDKKAAIIIHGIGVHPDWATVINPLRVSLTTQNYSTLSIQMPVLANGVDGKEYQGLMSDASARIARSVDYLEQEGFSVDLIIAHSLGSTMASNYLAHTPNPINKYISIGANFGSVDNLAKIDISVLDLLGTDDLEAVKNSANERKNSAKHNTNYQQKVITGNHFFSENTKNLIHTVHKWIAAQQ